MMDVVTEGCVTLGYIEDMMVFATAIPLSIIISRPRECSGGAWPT